MTTWLKHLEEVGSEDRSSFGGKCHSLAVLAREGFLVPPGICIGFGAYQHFVAEANLEKRIHFELGRKSFEDMRWEELWDLSLRIRNMFITSPFPADLKSDLVKAVEATFGDSPVAVRSSAAGEDSADRSFAGLHDSYVNVRGAESILDHVKLVWASLWSDRALLYRQELGLDPERSVMGVAVQRLMAGDASGVAFSRSPDSGDQALIEAVHGLNQGLVDGTVEPDHWVVDRATGAVVSHRPAERLKTMVPGAEGLELVSLDTSTAGRPPLDEAGLEAVLSMAMRAERVFDSPQDVEWTLAGGDLHTLQARPITTLRRKGEDDDRSWYVSLTRSFENLKGLRERIEEEIIPGMDRDAADLEAASVEELADADLAAEIEIRLGVLDRWTKAYWAYCIPFAHGMRLFGQVYNDVVRPEDPYEFMELLSGERTLGLERNSLLEEMADAVRSDPDLARALRGQEDISGHTAFARLLDSFIGAYGAISRATATEPPSPGARERVIGLVLEMAGGDRRAASAGARDRSELESDFLALFEGRRKKFAGDLLDLARASYRWRDDDNIYLARVEAETARAADHGRRRVAARLGIDARGLSPEDVSRALRDHRYRPESKGPKEPAPEKKPDISLTSRQLTGLPAGPGIGTGPARIIAASEDLYAFKSGEVLVCDAIEPEMTLVVPLAAGIVERRGGMLIHGAIVAREYGIPCVTGVPDAASLIRRGDRVTVDGYLGIVVVDAEPNRRVAA
jgi:phosphoenolpyruvate synthase/pyruvate phosphate dikinase